MPELAVEFIPDFDHNPHMNRFPDKWQAKEAAPIQMETVTATTRTRFALATHLRKESNETDKPDESDRSPINRL
jgi:hypothetical protein